MPEIIDDKSEHCIPFILSRLKEHRERSGKDGPPFFLGLNGVQGAGKTTLVGDAASICLLGFARTSRRGGERRYGKEMPQRGAERGRETGCEVSEQRVSNSIYASHSRSSDDLSTLLITSLATV